MPDKKQFEKIAAILNMEVSKIGLAPGDTVWEVKGTCYSCTERSSRCYIDCRKHSTKYLKKTTVRKVNLSIHDDNPPSYEFVDAEGECFSLKDIDSWVFTDKETAVKKLDD